MSAERKETIRRIVTETPGFLSPDNQTYHLDSFLNDYALRMIGSLDDLLLDRRERNDLGLSLDHPPFITTVYSPDNPNLIGIMIVGLEKDRSRHESVTVRRQIVIVDHEPKEVENFEQFESTLQAKQVKSIILELDDSQGSPIEEILINEGQTRIVVLKGKISDWTQKQKGFL